MSYNYGGGGGSQNLSQVLVVGNDAGGNSIGSVISYGLTNNAQISEDDDDGLNFLDGFGQPLNWNSDNYGLYCPNQQPLTGFGSIYDANFVLVMNIPSRLLFDVSQQSSADLSNRYLISADGVSAKLSWSGNLNAPQLPTSDPGNPGDLYQLSGVVMVSL